MYETSREASEEVLQVLETLQDRVWLPYKVGHEFCEDRLRVIEKQQKAFTKNLVSLQGSLEVFFTFLEKEEFSPLDKSQYVSSYRRFSKKLEQLKTVQQAEYKKILETDDILRRINAVFESKLGDPYTEKELDEIYAQGAARYSQKVPPGFEDLKQKKDQGKYHLYGDLILWRQIIDKSKKDKLPVIFITQDHKSDWWRIIGEKTISPHPELISEFFRETAERMWIYDTSSFIKYAIKQLNLPSVKEGTIKELEKVSMSYEIVGNEETGVGGTTDPQKLDIASSSD